jgi:hypothetical protein
MGLNSIRAFYGMNSWQAARWRKRHLGGTVCHHGHLSNLGSPLAAQWLSCIGVLVCAEATRAASASDWSSKWRTAPGSFKC